MIQLDIFEVIELHEDENAYGEDQTEILLVGESMGYVKGYSYTHEEALDVLRQVLKPLADAIKAHPKVSQTSAHEDWEAEQERYA